MNICDVLSREAVAECVKSKTAAGMNSHW